MRQNNQIFELTESIDSLLASIEGAYQTEMQKNPTPELSAGDVFQGDLSSVAELEAAGFNEPQISEISLGLDMNLHVERYARLGYTWQQMREIRYGLSFGLDTTVYENPLYSVEQMRELRLGMLSHVDVARYANLVFSATDMHKIRMELSEAVYRKDPTGYGRRFTDENSGLIIRISDDCMDAYITLPQNVTGRFSTNRLTKILRQHEITFGLLALELERFSRECPRDTEVKIAHGAKPVLGYDGHYEYYFNTHLGGAPQIKADGSVDYSTVQVTEPVKPGQKLATYFPAKDGVTGNTVTGIVLKATQGQQLPPLSGEGFHFDPNKNEYTAMYAGNVTLQEETYSLNVWKTFVIDGDATRFTGNMDYDGTVVVMGDAHNLARIKATGDIVVNGVVGDAELYAGNNIMIRGGANSGGKGYIEAAGSITGSFFESTKLKAGGPIEGNYFLNCSIETDDVVTARGKNSLIQGCQLKATLGVQARYFRTAGGSKTVIEVGNVAHLTDQRQEIAKQITQIEEETQKLEDGKMKLLQLYGIDLAEGLPIYQKTNQALEQMESRREHLQLQDGLLEDLIKKASLAYIDILTSMQAGIRIIVNKENKILNSDLKFITVTSTTFPREEKR